MSRQNQVWLSLVCLLILSASLAHNRQVSQPSYQPQPQSAQVASPPVASREVDPLVKHIPWLLWTILVSAGSISLYVLVNEIRLQRRLSAMPSSLMPRYTQPSPPAFRSTPSSRPVPTPSASPTRPHSWKEEKLYNDLKVLLRGDTEKLKRLMRLTMLKHPGRDMEWCYEKTIWDLERDRRA